MYVNIYKHIYTRIYIYLGIADPKKRAATAIKIAEKLGDNLCIFNTQN
jgi:hypothetical protein